MRIACTFLVASTFATSIFAHRDILRRAAATNLTDTSTAYLPAIVGYVTTACRTACTPMGTGLSYCATKQKTDAAIAACLCNAIVLTAVENCGICISKDPASTSGTSALENYNAFVNQCISINLATSAALAPLNSTTNETSVASTTLANITSVPVTATPSVTSPIVIVTSANATGITVVASSKPSIASGTITFTGLVYSSNETSTSASAAATSATRPASAGVRVTSSGVLLGAIGFTTAWLAF